MSLCPTRNKQRDYFKNLSDSRGVNCNQWDKLAFLRIEPLGLRQGMKRRLDFFDKNINLITDENDQDSIDYNSNDQEIFGIENSNDSAYSDLRSN